MREHVVVANLATGPDGDQRAIDARMLFHHAKTASFVAGAELRHQLTARLGVTWSDVRNGIAEVEGVPRTAMEEMSTRSKEIAEAAAVQGSTSARARQVAAWDTRAAKEHAVDMAALLASWDERLTACGYGPEERAAVLDKVAAPGLFGEEVRAQVFARLARVDGITEHEPVFDRRRVVQRLAELADERLSGDAVDALADAFLEQDQLVALEAPQGQGGASIQRQDGRVVALPGGPLYSTKAMLALERRALFAYSRGRRAGIGVVSDDVLARVLDEERFTRLSEEQRAFVTGLVTSGMRIQAGLGAAGTGKTTALEAAVAAWQASGYRVLGAAVGGTQAVVLSEETGIEAKTVASILARTLQHGDASLVDARTVVLVDEASLVSTRDFVALARLVEEQGATLRLVGDPAQHTSVEAGGVFRYLVEHHPKDTPALTHLYRQQGPEMAEVRRAATELREGKVVQALERLAADGRITEAESGGEAYERLVSAWYAERQRRLADPSRRRSAMTAEHHLERRELIRRARTLLEADGTLRGPELVVGEVSFRAGDEVVARTADRELRAAGAPRDTYVRNGSLGTVVEVRGDGLVVDFERWGRVPIGRAYLERVVSPGVVGGLQHAYALTTHAAQGETFAVAAPLVSDASSREGVYVGITRAQLDVQAVVVRRRYGGSHVVDEDLPALGDETGALEAAERKLASLRRPLLAIEHLRGGGEVVSGGPQRSTRSLRPQQAGDRRAESLLARGMAQGRVESVDGVTNDCDGVSYPRRPAPSRAPGQSLNG